MIPANSPRVAMIKPGATPFHAACDRWSLARHGAGVPEAVGAPVVGSVVADGARGEVVDGEEVFRSWEKKHAHLRAPGADE